MHGRGWGGRGVRGRSQPCSAWVMSACSAALSLPPSVPLPWAAESCGGCPKHGAPQGPAKARSSAGAGATRGAVAQGNRLLLLLPRKGLNQGLPAAATAVGVSLSNSTTPQLQATFCDSWVPQLQGNRRDDLVSFSICFLELIKLNFPDLKSRLV